MPQHILVTGPGKTGTTGVYTSVKKGLADAGIEVRTLFEPAQSHVVDNLFRYAPDVPVMTKVTLDKLRRVVPDPRAFDRRVMTVRDPRDVLVSALLFRPLTVVAIRRAEEEAVARFIGALKEKEADPSVHSVRDLYELANRLGIGSPPFDAMAKVMERQREMRDAGLVHVLHYERFVEDDLADLSSYLGFDVVNTSARDATWFGHIARSGSSGDYRRWFTPDDLTFFDGLFGPYLDAFGYPRDVALDPEPTIDPATSSEYVRDRYDDRRGKLAALAAGRDPEWRPRDVDSEEALGRLVERADDGDFSMCLRVAEVHLSGHLAGVDEQAALQWARRAAQFGSARGMRMTVDLLTALDPDDPALRREIRAWRQELASRSRRQDTQLTTRVADLEAELGQLRASTRYRVGSLVTAAAKDPVRRGPRAVRGLVGMAWRRVRARGADRSNKPRGA